MWNCNVYGWHSQSVKRVDNAWESSIMSSETSKAVKDDVYYIGKLDKSIYKCVTEDIQSEDVIITEKQVEHIKTHHPNDYERYFQYAESIISDPDYILEANKPNSAFLLKHIEENNKNYEIILRLKTSNDPAEYKNSIITFLKVEEKRYQRYLRTKKILYKKE